MKQSKRKLLSLLMALVMVLSLMPTTAWATEPEITGNITANKTSVKVNDEVEFGLSGVQVPSGYNQATTKEWSVTKGDAQPSSSNSNTGDSYTYKFTEAGTYTVTCVLTAEKKEPENEGGDNENGGNGNNTPAQQSEDNTVTGTLRMTVNVTDDYTVTISGDTMTMAADADTLTLTAEVKKNGSKENVTVTWTSSDESVATVSGGTVTRVGSSGTTKITASYTADGQTYKDEKTITVKSPVSISYSSGASLDSWDDEVVLTASYSKATASTEYEWEVTGNTAFFSYNDKTTSNTLTLKPSELSSTTKKVTVKVSVTDGSNTYSAEQEVTLKFSTNYSVAASVYADSDGYALGDTDDAGKSSIMDQINAKLSTKEYIKELWFDSASATYGKLYDYYGDSASTSSRYAYDADEAEDVVFVPSSSAKAKDKATFIAYVVTNYDEYTFEIVFTIVDGVSAKGGDIVYSASLGEDVSFDVSDFEDFWAETYKNGTLNYVTFTLPSGGTLKDSDGNVKTSTRYYASPSKTSYDDLADVYFSPSSTTSKKATTVKISFTAYGSSTSSSGSGRELEGTISIVYLSSAAKKITYNTDSSGKVSLDPSDFITAYQEATGKNTKNPDLTIQFQGAPTYGTLTYNDSSKTNAKDVELTSAKLKSTKFNVKTTKVSNKIEDVTYSVSGTRTDTISYIGYIGGTATFTGEVTFNAVTAPTNVTVSYTCYSSTGVALTPAYFTGANTAMTSASHVILGTPRMGRLTNTSGNNAANTAVLVSLLGSVTYVPTSATPGTAVTDSFTFTAYNASGTVVASGNVNVTISLPANTVTPSGGITNISQLTDVPSTAYYRSQLTNLINRGVISGTGNGQFAPDRQVEYSEALKFIMNAAGYFETNATGAGVNWAQNYKNTAVQRGWISSSVDLTKPIGREAMAELAARILGIPQATGASPFVDTNSPWATALFNATYTSGGVTGRIVQGDVWDNGTRHFNPDKALYRHEMVCLVYNMYMYRGN